MFTHQQQRFMSAAPEESSAAPDEVPENIKALVDELCSLNVIEMNQLVTLFKDKVGLTGADEMPMMGAPMGGFAAPAGAAPAGAAPAAAEEEEAAAEKEFFGESREILAALPLPPTAQLSASPPAPPATSCG